LRIELGLNELHFLKQLIESAQIVGKDAIVVARLLTKVTNGCDKEVKKKEATNGNKLATNIN